MSSVNNKAIGYCRVAAIKQTKGYSNLDTQKQQIEKIAKSLNLEIVELFEQVRHEPITSPNDTLGKALKYCKANSDIKFLIIVKPDRISRSLEEYIFWKTSFSRAGVTIISTFNSEPNSPVECFMDSLYVMIGQLDYIHRSEAIKRGIQAKKDREA